MQGLTCNQALLCFHMPPQATLCSPLRAQRAGQQSHFGPKGSLIYGDTGNPKQNCRKPRRIRHRTHRTPAGLAVCPSASLSQWHALWH